MSQARRDVRAVRLDLHAPTAPVPELTACEVTIEVVARDLETGGQTLENGYQSGAM